MLCSIAYFFACMQEQLVKTQQHPTLAHNSRCFWLLRPPHLICLFYQINLMQKCRCRTGLWGNIWIRSVTLCSASCWVGVRGGRPSLVVVVVPCPFSMMRAGPPCRRQQINNVDETLVVWLIINLMFKYFQSKVESDLSIICWNICGLEWMLIQSTCRKKNLTIFWLLE